MCIRDSYHTANNISTGTRVVLVSFWQRRANSQPTARAEDERGGLAMLRAMAVSPVGIPVELSRQALDPNLHLHPHPHPLQLPLGVARTLYAQHRAVTLQLNQLLLPLCNGGATLLQAASSECLSACTKCQASAELLDRFDSPNQVPRTCFEQFERARAALAVDGQAGGAINRFLLSSLPALVQAIIQPDDPVPTDRKRLQQSVTTGREIYLYNERFVQLDAGPSEGWVCEGDELGMCYVSEQEPEFYTVWIPLTSRHTLDLKANEDALAEAIGIQLELGEAVLVSSKAQYSHAAFWHRPMLHLWCVQYSTRPITVPKDPHPIALAVRCHPVPVTEFPHDRRLSETNGVTAFESEAQAEGEGEDQQAETGTLMPLEVPGDCALLYTRVWHRSVPSESDRMLLKLVLFFKVASGSDEPVDPKGRICASLKCARPELITGCFTEVLGMWDSLASLPPSEQSIWTPYQGYQRTNTQPTAAPSENNLDQLRNVRRVTQLQLHRFRQQPTLGSTAALIGHLEQAAIAEAGYGLELMDLHFLRQFGANSASFSAHQDIQDTGEAATTQIAVGLSVLLGGWTVPPPVPSHDSEQRCHDGAWVGWCGPAEAEAVSAATRNVRFLTESEIHRSVSSVEHRTIGGCDCPGGRCGEYENHCRCIRLGREEAATEESGQCGASLYECNASCGCGLSCPNRASQQQDLDSGLELFSCGSPPGLGLGFRNNFSDVTQHKLAFSNRPLGPEPQPFPRRGTTRKELQP
eukprot:TRINITY_DN11836_c0_g1_i13.p1 TRINITY_DN11836_c0_g1~~TRINITY_DN11836_c0_g1_i13.p1  ORF type:complete len:752 (-),score=128.52 TRINITY_DN11836_c0_g1_i13:952-3207(-)